MAEQDDNPWSDLERLGGRAPAIRKALERFGTGLAASPWTPPSDFMETDEAYVFEIELAGVRRGDIRLELSGDMLRVSGERLSGGEAGTAAYHLVERAKGGFSRVFVLPGEVDSDRAFASFGDGLLTVTLPKKRSEIRRIEIEEE